MAEKQEDEDLKLTEQQDGSVAVGEPPAEDPEDESLKTEDHDDEQGSEGESEEEAEARRERNRQRRAESKQKRKDYVEALKRELAARDSIINDLSNRVAQVERRSTGSEMAQLETAEADAVKFYNHFKQVNEQAIEQANGKMAIEAQERMFQARQRIDQIKNLKRAMTQRQQQPQPLDPRLVTHAQEWVADREWYDPNGEDDDSAMVLAIDNKLAKDGWNPTTKEYWEELSKRVEKYLPHRAKQSYNGNKNRGHVPVAGSGRETVGASSGSYKLSSERVQALKDAGLWDDPKQRAEAIKRFQKYDKEQRA